MKITSLQFFDYRVFFAEAESDKENYLIKVDGKNLLIYGENGSGKTSLFNGLKDIIYQADFIPHFKTPLLNAGFVELEFDDGTHDRFDATGANATKAELINISKLNSFLSYKELLRTHFIGNNEIDFFKLLVNDILNEHELQTLGQLKSAWEKLTSKDLGTEKQAINASIAPATNEGEEAEDLFTKEEAKEQIEKLEADFQTDITKFYDEFDYLLKDINSEIGKIINYFNQGIEIEFELESLTIVNLSSPKLNAKVKYAGTVLPSHQSFLNEAKLSAIALSIYLTALQSNPTQGTIKFIFLDDVFLGLDLNNRLPLLDILKEKFPDWQIFLTTYDRHWFEVAKQHLNSDWKAIEMYATSVEGKLFDKPLIIQSYDYFVKANNYFSAGDYPASLNYLRKELESQIKARLPEESTRYYEGKPHQLVHLWELLVERYNRNKQGELVTEKIKDELKVARFSLLNPQSHDDLSAPVYKYELQRAIDLIKDIQNIPIIKGVTLLITGMELVFKHPQLNYTMTMELLEDWQIDIIGTDKKHRFPNCKLKHWQFNDSDYYNTHSNAPGDKPSKLPEAKLNAVRNNLIAQGLLQPLTEKTFNANTTFESIWSVEELIDRCDNEKKDSRFDRIFRKGFKGALIGGIIGASSGYVLSRSKDKKVDRR